MARPRSKSAFVGATVAVVASLAILAACFGLAAIGEDRTDDVSRGAAGGSYSANTTVNFTVRNSLPVAVTLTAAVSDESGWNGTKPTDSAAFADRTIAAAGSHGADLVFATSRSKVPFTLTVATPTATVGTVVIDRDYLRETCTPVKQGKYTVNDCSQVNVWWLAPSSVWNDTRISGSSSSCPSSKNAATLGEYTDAKGVKQKVTFTVTCSSTTGATTGTLTQSAASGS